MDCLQNGQHSSYFLSRHHISVEAMTGGRHIEATTSLVESMRPARYQPPKIMITIAVRHIFASLLPFLRRSMNTVVVMPFSPPPYEVSGRGRLGGRRRRG